MSQVSQFQKQILSELGIVSWKLRDDENAKSEEHESSQEVLSEPVKSQAAAASKSSGLSGLELIKQQMAKSGETKTPAPKTPAAKAAVTTAPEPKDPEVSTVIEPIKPVLEFKSEVLLWQSTGMPVADVQLAFEILEIPFQLVTSDSEPTHRFALLVATQTPQKLLADKLIIMNSPEARKQLWQALMDFIQAMDKAN